MLSIGDLIRELGTFRPAPDAQRHQAANAPASASLFIGAGRGMRKTASLTLHILKLVLVHGIPPRGVLAMTFTKKAAKEIRPRVLGWVFRVFYTLKNVVPSQGISTFPRLISGGHAGQNGGARGR